MDDHELRKLLNETLKLGRENNLMLRKLIWAERRAMIVRVIYWIIIIGSSVGLYYVVQPYVQPFVNYYSHLVGQ